MRRRYLATYDVACTKRRNQIFKILVAYGEHVQYSVFLCELTEREKIELTSKLHEHIHQQEDQLIYVDMGQVDRDIFESLETLGRAYEVPSRSLIV